MIEDIKTEQVQTVTVDGQKAEVVGENQSLPKNISLPDPLQYKIEDFLNILLALRSTIKTVSVAPTYVPRSVPEQIVLYSNGGTYKVYFYIVGIGWKSVILS